MSTPLWAESRQNVSCFQSNKLFNFRSGVIPSLVDISVNTAVDRYLTEIAAINPFTADPVKALRFDILV